MHQVLLSKYFRAELKQRIWERGLFQRVLLLNSLLFFATSPSWVKRGNDFSGSILLNRGKSQFFSIREKKIIDFHFKEFLSPKKLSISILYYENITSLSDGFCHSTQRNIWKLVDTLQLGKWSKCTFVLIVFPKGILPIPDGNQDNKLRCRSSLQIPYKIIKFIWVSISPGVLTYLKNLVTSAGRL